MITVTTNNFENDVLHADKHVLLDFWQTLSPYCRRIEQFFDNVYAQYQLIERLGIDTIPTLMLFRNGKAEASITAPSSKAEIEAFLNMAFQK